MPSYSLPVFYCPFSTHLNIHHDHSWACSREWLRQVGLLQGERAAQRLERSGFSQLTALAYPYANAHQLKVAINWLIWLFLFDDQLDECYLGHQKHAAAEVIDRLIAHARLALHPRTRTQSPVEKAFVALWIEYAADLSPAQQRRFMQNIRNYLSSLRWEVESRADGTVPSLITFVELRRNTGAVRLAIDLIEYSLHAEIPDVVANSTEMEMLKNCTNDVICMSNDLFSFEKEQARGDVNNLLVVWQKNHDCSLDVAVAAIYALILERQNQFIETRQKLVSLVASLALDDACRLRIEHYVTGMEHWMKANLEYSLSTPRYSDIEASQQGLPVSWVENISAMPSAVFVAP